jgi:hypothetical protein
LFSLNFAPTDAASNSDAASIFNLPLKQNSNYTFALNIPDGSSDLYLHLSGPTDYSWVAVGTGNQMKDSLMFVLYSDTNGKSQSSAPRTAHLVGELDYTDSPLQTLLSALASALVNKSLYIHLQSRSIFWMGLTFPTIP